jgi:hypothetical protein
VIKNRLDQCEALLNFALSNLFFYRAKSISLDLKSHQVAHALILGCDGEQFPMYAGKIVKVSESIEPDHIYNLAKLLIEQFCTPARKDISLKVPFDNYHNYIGLVLTGVVDTPFPIMVSCINKGQGIFYLQFTVQNLEKKLEVLRAELDEWHAKNKDTLIRLNVKSGIAI